MGASSLWVALRASARRRVESSCLRSCADRPHVSPRSRDRVGLDWEPHEQIAFLNGMSGAKDRIVAVALLTREDVRTLGDMLKKVYRVDNGGDFESLLKALDDAHQNRQTYVNRVFYQELSSREHVERASQQED